MSQNGNKGGPAGGIFHLPALFVHSVIMPLPTNDPVAFRGVPSLGANKKMALTMTFTQKQVEAMFERHDALRAQGSSLCPLEIDFDDNKIYIGEIVTPFTRVKEDGTREICQRSPTVSKPLAGITLAGNVIGKLNIERDYEQVADSIRKLTEAEVSKRKERHIVRLDSPPIMSNGKKSKSTSGASSLAKKAMTNRIASTQAPSGRKSVPNSSTGRSAHAKTSSLNTRSTSNSLAGLSTSGSSTSQATTSAPTTTDLDLTSLRSHMVHYLAFDPKTTEDVLLKMGGHNASAETVLEIEETLTTVAEEVRRPKNAPPGPVLWQLRLRSWEEIRPYEYGSLSDADRKKLARKGRLALGGTVVPNDPLWDHFRSDVDISAISSSTTAKSREKSTTSGPLVKTSDFKGGMYPKEKTSVAKGGGAMSGGVTKKKTAAAKSRVKKEQEDGVEVKAQKVVASLDDAKGKGKAGPSAPSISGLPTNNPRLNVEDQEDDAMSVSAKSRTSLATSKKDGPPPLSKSRRIQDGEGSSKRRLVDIGEDAGSETEEGELPSKLPAKKRKLAVDVTKSKSSEKNGAPVNKAAKDNEPVSENIPLKAMKDGSIISRSSLVSSASKAGGPAGSKVVRSERDRERERQERETLEAEHAKDREREKRRSSGKRARRVTPSFSSDEDEMEIKPPSSRPTKPKPVTQTSKSGGSVSKVVHVPSPVLPTDKDSLRRRYHTCYARYMGVTSKFHEQRAKIEEALLADADGVSVDDDADMMDTEQLMQLCGEHDRLRDELERIQRAHVMAS